MIKNVPRCGSKNIKKEIKIESNLPGMLTYCVDCKTRIKWEDWLGGMPPSQSALEDKEWDRYQEEFTFNQPPYFKYLWIKNTQNEISLDISSRNIERCEKFYNENPHDKDGLYRIMILKVALGEETKELLDKFLEATAVGNGAYNFLTGLGEGVCDDSRFLEALNPYLPNIKKFLIWFLEKNPGAIRNSNFSKDWEELFYLIPICEIVGIQAIFELLDIDSLLSDRVVIVGEEEDLVIAAYAEFCYKEKRWFDALRVYELLLNKEKINPVGVGYDYSFLEYFSDLMSDYPTIEKIQGRCLECLKKAAEGQDCSRIFDLLFKRLELLIFKKRVLKEKKKI